VLLYRNRQKETGEEFSAFMQGLSPKTIPMNIGILGGGQLGRMLAMAGLPLGESFRVLEPSVGCPASAVAEHYRGEFEDHQTLYHFCQKLDAITYEFENVPVDSARWLAERVPVFPPPEALAIAQDRIAEKTFFRELGANVPPFRAVESRDDLDEAVASIGLPAVLKTTRFGYDGKGQAVLRTTAEVDAAWSTLGGRPLIYEGFVPFEREFSILGVRSRSGELGFYPLAENVHRAGMLRVSRVPSPNATPDLQTRAEAIAARAMQKLDYVGVLAVELFHVGDELVVNEMAPRVHNSGHWSIDGAVTSQFENHIRAVAGLPLGPCDAVGTSVMLNLIGHWPDPATILAVPGAHLHLYGKGPRPNRKVGHVTVCGDSHEAIAEAVEQVQRRIDGE
jgi:5-(carboxyamino)imidazole ribonucleotide synthase